MTIALVNHSNYRVGTGGGTAPGASALNVASGNLLVVAISTINTAHTVNSITDTAGNTFASTGLTATEQNGGQTVLWYAKNTIANASDVVTVNLATAATEIYIGVFQFSGCDTTAPFDVGATGVSNNAGASVTSGSFTPANQGELLFATTALASTTAISSWNTTAGFTGIDQYSTFPEIGNEYDTTGAGGAQTVTMSVNGGSGYYFSMVVAAFKASAPVAGTGVATPQFTMSGGGTQTKTPWITRVLSLLGIGSSTPTLPLPNIGPPLDPNWPVASLLSNSSVASLSVATPTVPVGTRLIYAMILWNTYAGANATPVTVSGLGLPWTKILANSDPSGQEGAELWATWAAAPLSAGTITAAFSGGGANNALQLQPKTSTTASETHAGLVTSTASMGPAAFHFTGKAITVAQLRQNSTPNPWEVAWIFWNYTNDTHFYSFVIKPNGWELGREDPTAPGNQIYLATGSSPTMPVGTQYSFDIAINGAQMTVSINGTQVVTYDDSANPNGGYTTGQIGMYCEDSKVQFDDLSAPIVENFNSYSLQSFTDGQTFGTGNEWTSQYNGFGTNSISSSVMGGGTLAVDAALVAYARSGTKNGQQDVTACFGAKATSVDMTGSPVGTDITLTNVQNNSGAVVGVMNGSATPLVAEADTIVDSLSTPRGSLLVGTFRTLTGNTITTGGGGGGTGGGVPTSPPANGTTVWHPATGDTTYVDPTAPAYGAKGDGITDDTAAFRNAAATRKPMFIPAPPGGAFYKLSGFVQLYNSVYGDGSMPKLQMTGSTGDAPGSTHNYVTLYVNSTSGTSISPKIIQGVTIDGGWNGGTAGEYSHGVALTGAAYWTIQYCNITNAYGDDIWFGGGLAGSAGICDHISVLHCTLGTPRRCNVSSDWCTNATVQYNVITKQNSYVASIDWEPDALGTQSDNYILVDSNEFHVVAIDFNGAAVNCNNPAGNPPSGHVTVTNNYGHWSPVAAYMNVFPDSGGLAGVVPNQSWSNLLASNNVVTTPS